MTNPARSIRVFVSSTSEDLKDYRAVARNVILDMQWQPEMMEHFGAMTQPTVRACCDVVERCDLLVLVVAWRQGWVPSQEQGGNGRDSVTALELAHARAKRIPVLILLANRSWPGDLWEDDQAKRAWVKSFRDNLGQPAAFFDYESSTTREGERLIGFRATLKQALLDFKAQLPVWNEPESPPLEFFRSARQGLFEGTSIPVLGSGIHGDGGLGSSGLVRALLEPVNAPVPSPSGGESEERLALATAAEWRERFDGSRFTFLTSFQDILREQTAAATEPPLIRLLCGLDRLRLVVSTTYDLMLERALENAGRKFTLITHVLHSYEGANDCKLLVFRPGGAPEFASGEMLCFTPEDLVVYKPLGSPLLHDRLDPDLEIDTAVVTEADHALFLQRLASPATGVPNALRTRFRRSPLLFLGYSMDAWQYRMMMLMFQSVGRQARNASTFAVRIPEAQIEEIAWNHLKASLIRMDPGQFARTAQGAGAGAG